VLDLSNGALTKFLHTRCHRVISEKICDNEQFDYIISIDPNDFGIEAFRKLYEKLTPSGKLLLAFENPFALRYWSGKRSPVSGMPYYPLLSRDDRISKAETSKRLTEAGFGGQKWYYPLADHWFTQVIYSENQLPDENFTQHFTPYIYDDFTLMYDERSIYKEVIRNNAFEFMCNAYLVEARVNAQDEPCKVDFAENEKINENSSILNLPEFETAKSLDTIKNNRFYPVIKQLSLLGFRCPAIYGFGVRGKRIKQVMEDYLVPISGIFDKNIKTEKPFETMLIESSADVIIVSILGGEEIAADLRCLTSTPVYTVEQLLYEQP